MPDIRISQLSTYTPVTDDVIIPMSYTSDIDGKYHSAKIVLEDVSDFIISKLKSGNGITINKSNTTGEYTISTNLDLSVYVIPEDDKLPTSNIQKKIYLIINPDAEEGNTFDEYVFIGGDYETGQGNWEKIDSAGKIDLSDYATTSFVEQTANEIILGYTTANNIIQESNRDINEKISYILHKFEMYDERFGFDGTGFTKPFLMINNPSSYLYVSNDGV